MGDAHPTGLRRGVIEKLRMNAVLETETVTGELRGRLRLDESMSLHTTWRVGGAARCFFEPADVDDLAHFLAGLPTDEPIFWLGRGSNLLVRDGGVPGTVILTAGLLNDMERVGARGLRVEAGVACAKVARLATHEGLGGAEFLAGIPGTMGGALAMNAGAFGGDTWSLVNRVETMDRKGRRQVRRPREYRVDYREVRGCTGEWFIAAYLDLQPGDTGAAMEKGGKLLEKRSATQPVGQATCGSVFRNPPGDHAGRLIDACGFKGASIGGAQVSEKHANFIVNTGEATAADIEALMKKVADAVEKTHGVRLVREVKIIGLAVKNGG